MNLKNDIKKGEVDSDKHMHETEDNKRQEMGGELESALK